MHRDWHKRVGRIGIVAGVLLAVLWPSNARADAGYPMILAIWPTALGLLIPVVMVEALIAQRVFKRGFLHGLKLSAAANVVSTIIGIPLTWYLLALAENEFLAWFAPSTSENATLVALTLGSPWLMPMDLDRDLPWMIPAAGLSLCVPFYFISVLCEALAARRLVGWSQRGDVWRWAWIANALSYLLLVGCLGIRLYIAL